MTPTSALSFGVDNVIPFSLTGSPVDDSATWWWDVTAGGIDFGNPDAIITEIQSQLLDGSLGSITSWENRTVVLTLRLWGSSVADLEDGEAALLAEVDRAGWNQLSWTPSIDGSATTVYDVVYSVLAFTLDEASERNLIRNYTLTLTCLPRPRSADPVSVESLPVVQPTPSITVVNDGSSAAGWSTTGLAEIGRNLIPNPSFEYGTAGWQPGAGAAGITRYASGPGSDGAYAWFPPTTTAVTVYANGSRMPVSAGTTYYMGLSSSDSCRGVLVRFYNSADSQVGSDVDHAMSFSGNEWSAHSVAVTVPAGATSMAIFPHGQYGLVLDDVYVSTTNAYFDGDQPASGGTSYGWVGQRGNSPSVALRPASPAVVGGAVTVKVFGGEADLELPGSIDATAEIYVGVTGRVSYSEGSTPSGAGFKLVAGGATYSAAFLQYDATGSFTAYFHVGAVISTARLVATAQGSPGFTTLAIDQVVTSDGLPVLGSPHQQYRQLSVYGSARTQASLRVETTEAELGPETLVFATPPQSSGFQPPLRSHRIGGPTSSTSSTAASGATNTLATSQAAADHWSISTSILQPATYELYALLSVAATTTVTLSWQASGTAAGTPTVTGSRTVTLQAGYQFVAVGSIELPTARAYAGSSDDVQLWLWASATGVTIDDGYLFSGAGHLAIIGTAGCSLLLLNSASIDEPEATAWVGKAAGSSGGDPDVDTDVVYAGNRAQAWEQLQFAPPSTNVFVVTPGTTQAQVSMTYYPRWGHHAGRVAA